MKQLILLSLAIILILPGCSVMKPGFLDGTSPAATPTRALLYSKEANTDAVSTAALKYLDAWKRDDIQTMYPLLTSLSQDAITLEEFKNHYQSIAVESALDGVDTEILSVMVNPDSAQVRYRVTLHSVLVGDISRETVMNLRLESSEWRIEWDDSLVLPELKGSNYLVMNRSGYIPARANIYDRNGQALVAQADSTAVGLLPDRVDPTKADEIFETISEITGVDTGTIRTLYESAPSGADWYIPIGEVSGEVISSQYSTLSELEGIRLQPYKFALLYRRRDRSTCDRLC